MADSPIRIMTVFGTRPEAIKMAPLVKLLKADSRFECKVCVSGQHRELLDSVLKEFDIVPDYDLNVMRAGQSFAEVSGKVLLGLDEVLNTYTPDMIVVHGDTSTSVAAALTAFYRGIPVAHVEAGLRTYSKDSPFPEELNRQLTSRIADVHFAPTQTAAQNLINEGVPEERIVVTGNTAIDALRICKAQFTGRPKRPYVLVTCHRKENISAHLYDILSGVIDAAREFPTTDFIYLMHPNPEVKAVVDTLNAPANFIIREAAGYAEMVQLIAGCGFIVSDSGGLQEEAPSFGKPVLLTRYSTERPEAVEAGNVCLVGTDRTAIYSTIKLLCTDASVYQAMSRKSSPYGDGHASEMIVEMLAACFAAAE